METTPLLANFGLMCTLGPGGAPPFLGENLGLMWGLAAPSLQPSSSILAALLGFKAPAGLLVPLRSDSPNLSTAAAGRTKATLLSGAQLVNGPHSENTLTV